MSIGQAFLDSLFICCCTPITKKQKYNLIENKITTSDRHTWCAICLDNFTKNVVILPKCKHKFHKKCIIDWFDRKMECPLCKTNYTSLDYLKN